MKKTLLVLVVAISSLFAYNVQAQSWDTGLDIYSSYIWRGAKFGDGAAFQPYVEFAAGDFAVGAWGSVNSGSEEALEMDLYAGYDFGPVSITVTDYYFGGDWTDGDMHAFEPSLGLSLGDFGLTAAYMTGDGIDDTYLEAAYSFGSVDLAIGAGDGQYTYVENEDGTVDDDFGICNITVGTSKDIEITDTFVLPVSGSVTLNPTTGGFFITAGLSL